MPTTNCLVYEQRGEWAAALRQRVPPAMGGIRVVEIREWDGLLAALRDAPTSIIAVDAAYIRPTSWMARWPAIVECFPLARAMVLAQHHDLAAEAALRDVGIVEVIRGRGDLDCMVALLARQRARYPEGPVSWRSTILRRLPWGSVYVAEVD